VSADILNYDFDKLVAAQLQHGKGRLFDAIMMDPPWNISGPNPTRGVSINYDTLSDR
jgi:mRNA m6A methyltransferase catalytic subunit